MSSNIEEKILKKLEKIEDLLLKVIPQTIDTTEEEVLEIIKTAEKEHRQGKTRLLGSTSDLR